MDCARLADQGASRGFSTAGQRLAIFASTSRLGEYLRTDQSRRLGAAVTHRNTLVRRHLPQQGQAFVDGYSQTQCRAFA